MPRFIPLKNFILSLKSQELPNKKKFTLYENKGSWTNNYGNYGTFFCYGSIQSITNSYEGLLVICEHLDSDDEKFWVLYERSNEGDEGGAGKSTYIEGVGKWKKFKGIKCIFSRLENKKGKVNRFALFHVSYMFISY